MAEEATTVIASAETMAVVFEDTSTANTSDKHTIVTTMETATSTQPQPFVIQERPPTTTPTAMVDNNDKKEIKPISTEVETQQHVEDEVNKVESFTPSPLKAKKAFFENVFKPKEPYSPVRSTSTPRRRSWSPRKKKQAKEMVAATETKGHVVVAPRPPPPTASCTVMDEKRAVVVEQPACDDNGQNETVSAIVTPRDSSNQNVVSSPTLLETADSAAAACQPRRDDKDQEADSPSKVVPPPVQTPLSTEYPAQEVQPPATPVQECSPTDKDQPTTELPAAADRDPVLPAEAKVETPAAQVVPPETRAVPSQGTTRPTPLNVMEPGMADDSPQAAGANATEFSELREMWEVKADKPLSPENDAVVGEANGTKIAKDESVTETLVVDTKLPTCVNVQEEKKEEPEEVQIRQMLSAAVTKTAANDITKEAPGRSTLRKPPTCYTMTPRSAMASESPQFSAARGLWGDQSTTEKGDGRKTPSSSKAMSFDPSDSVSVLRTTPHHHHHPVVTTPGDFAETSGVLNKAVNLAPTITEESTERPAGNSTAVSQDKSNMGMKTAEKLSKKVVVNSPDKQISPQQSKNNGIDQGKPRKVVVTSPMEFQNESDALNDDPNLKHADNTESTADETVLAGKTPFSRNLRDAKPEEVDSDEDDDDDFGDIRASPPKANTAAIKSSAASIANHARRSMEKYQAVLEITQQYRIEGGPPSPPIEEQIKKFEAFSRGEDVKNDVESETDKEDFVEVQGVPGKVDIQQELKKLEDIVAEEPRPSPKRALPPLEEVKEEVQGDAPSPTRFSFYTPSNETLNMLEKLSEPMNSDAFVEEQAAAKGTDVVTRDYVPRVVKAIEARFSSKSMADEQDEEDAEMVRVAKKAAAAVRKAAAKLNGHHTVDQLKKLPYKEVPGPDESMEQNPDCSILTDGALTAAEMDTTLALEEDVFEQGMALVGSVNVDATYPKTVGAHSTTTSSPKFEQPLSITRSNSGGQAVDHAKCGECIIL